MIIATIPCVANRLHEEDELEPSRDYLKVDNLFGGAWIDVKEGDRVSTVKLNRAGATALIEALKVIYPDLEHV